MKLKSFPLFEAEVRKNSRPEEKPEEPKTKDMKLGTTEDGTEVMCKMKVGHTIVLSAEEFSKLQNMRVSRNKEDMLGHYRGGKDYKISKDKDGKFSIFHYNKTIHELTPVGVFTLPEKRDTALEEGEDRAIEFGFFRKASPEDDKLLQKLRAKFDQAMLGGKEINGNQLFIGVTKKPEDDIFKILSSLGIPKQDVYTFT
jgi:hypothetical protein